MTIGRIHKKWKYAGVGALLGLGSPYGLFLLRLAAGFEGSLAAWLSRELAEMGGVYAYAAAATIVAFSAFGYVLGRSEDLLAEQTELAEESAEQYRRRAMTDDLTHVYARGCILARLDEELSRAKRYGAAMGCLFIDVDRFKELNDRWGHLAGDAVLEDLVKVMGRELRESDMLGRYGGDEFLAILPETDAGDAYRAAERLRKGVESARLGPRDPTCAVTVSVGVYASNQLPDDPRDILALADQALSQAKTIGRNRSVLMLSEQKPPRSFAF